MNKMKVERRIHQGWTEWDSIPDKIKNELKSFRYKGWCGKYQYIYSNNNKKISLVYVDVGLFPHRWVWEILQLHGNDLFEDVERFRTKKDALVRIKKLLK